MNDPQRCAGTRDYRGVSLGICYGCSRYTRGASSLSGIAYIAPATPQHTAHWTCDERVSVAEAHPQSIPQPPDSGAPRK